MAGIIKPRRGEKAAAIILFTDFYDGRHDFILTYLVSYFNHESTIIVNRNELDDR